MFLERVAEADCIRLVVNVVFCTGQSDSIHKVPVPKFIRAGNDQESDVAERAAADAFSESVRAACAAAANRTAWKPRDRLSMKKGVCAFIVESGMSVGGVIVPPLQALETAINHVHEAGGVCIVDEVQVGFGRVGSSFWGFALGGPGVCPDIVTMGKPFGNGFPLGAVVTTAEVAASFDGAGVEYFNTFGGNPVACAAGLAVLNEIEDKNLTTHASDVGAFLKESVIRLAHDPSGAGDLIADVRGVGLFIGIEFATNRDDPPARWKPATAQVSILCARLKVEHYILTSIDGPEHNVLVIKPPMTFGRADATYFVDCMKKVLPEITQDDIASYTHTST